LAASGEMAFALQNEFGEFVSAAADAAEESLSGLMESRLTNLAILSIERQTVQQVDFTKVIENFAAVRARKVLI